MRTLLAAAASLILLQPILMRAVAADQSARRERVTFAKGASSATRKGQLKDNAMVDYVVRAGAGQTLTVTIKKTNLSNYFNVLSPGSTDVAMYVGQTGEDFTGRLPTDGDYMIRVYLVRAAARRNESSNYTLTISVTGKALAPLPASQDAVLPGTPFHASAPITCVPVPYLDTKAKKCQAFVIRRGVDGTATVEIPQTVKVKRRILFAQGMPVASDSFEKLTFTRKGDITTVKFDSGERYEIPDALIFGG
jgi:hypothetical protein